MRFPRLLLHLHFHFQLILITASHPLTKLEYNLQSQGPPTTNFKENHRPRLFLFSQPSTNIDHITRVLETLGYNNEELALSTFPLLDSSTAHGSKSLYEDMAQLDPNARFILLLDSCEDKSTACDQYLAARENYLEKVRAFFVHAGRGTAVLEIELDRSGSVDVEAWRKLGSFLDIEYSLVERLRLRDFPDNKGMMRRGAMADTCVVSDCESGWRMAFHWLIKRKMVRFVVEKLSWATSRGM